MPERELPGIRPALLAGESQRVARTLVRIARVRALAPPYRLPDFSIKHTGTSAITKTRRIAGSVRWWQNSSWRRDDRAPFRAGTQCPRAGHRHRPIDEWTESF
ncbi:hypothetical protein GmRootV15_64780 (plasmid) [Variovorax sp. V15]